MAQSLGLTQRKVDSHFTFKNISESGIRVRDCKEWENISHFDVVWKRAHGFVISRVLSLARHSDETLQTMMHNCAVHFCLQWLIRALSQSTRLRRAPEFKRDRIVSWNGTFRLHESFDLRIEFQRNCFGTYNNINQVQVF